MKNYRTDKSRKAYFEKRLDKVEFNCLLEYVEDLLSRNKGFKHICRALALDFGLEMLDFEGDKIYIKIAEEFGQDKDGMRFISFIIGLDFDTEQPFIEQALLSSTDNNDEFDEIIEYPICAFNPYTLEMSEWLFNGEGVEVPMHRFLGRCD